MPERSAGSGAAPEHPVLTIVLPTDPLGGLRAAEDLAIALARTTGARLELLAAQPPATAAPSTSTVAARCDALTRRGLDAVICTPSASTQPAEAILRRSEDDGPLIICMSLNSRHAARSLLMSSVTEEVLRRARVPVLLAGPKMDAATGLRDRFVVACDGSDVAQAALAVATRVAALAGAELRVVQILHCGRTDGTGPQVAGPPIAEVLEDDDRAGAIMRTIHEPARTILVIGAHRRGGRRRFALGSVALDVVRSARCPVLVVPSTAASCTLATEGSDAPPVDTTVPAQPAGRSSR